MGQGLFPPEAHSREKNKATRQMGAIDEERGEQASAGISRPGLRTALWSERLCEAGPCASARLPGACQSRSPTDDKRNPPMKCEPSACRCETHTMSLGRTAGLFLVAPFVVENRALTDRLDAPDGLDAGLS